MLSFRPIALVSLLALGCAPRARPLTGAPTPARLPDTAVGSRPQRVVFRWEYAEESVSARGEGVARISPPDSARMDFFLDGGIGGGYAILIGSSLTTPGGAEVQRFLPPAPLMWAALGRLAVPASSDTVARVSGDTIRADIGRGEVWRATFVRARLARLERVDGGRIVEWVSRSADGVVRYHHETARRTLGLNVTSTTEVAGHASSIWAR
jgi:hypothetical protein